MTKDDQAPWPSPSPALPDGGDAIAPGNRGPSFSVIQQQLIDARDRLDLEVTRLTRMHAFNARALRLHSETDFVAAVAEAIVDIFELEFGVCWLLDESGKPDQQPGSLGIDADEDRLKSLGFGLTREGVRETRLLTAEALTSASGELPLNQAIQATCVDADGRPLAMLLGGITSVGSGFFDPLTPELRQPFGLFAQQLGALMENRRARTTIERQITEIKRADQRLRLALESNQAGLWDCDLSSHTVELSSGWASLLGQEPVTGPVGIDVWLTQLPEDDRKCLQEYLDKASSSSGAPFELTHRVLRQDGRLLWVLSRGHLLPDAAGQTRRIVGTTFDISRQRDLEAELEKERGFLRTLVRTIPDLVWLKNPEGVYLACNPKFESFFGATEEEIVGKSDYDFLPPDLADFFRGHDHAAMAAGGPTVNEEEVTYASDGHRGLLETIKTPMSDTQGGLIGVLGIARDITQRRQAEEQIRKLSRAVEQSPSSIVITDLEPRIEYVNNAFLQATGYSLEEVIGQNPRILKSGHTEPGTHASMWATLTRGEQWQGEFHNRRKDGSEYIEFAIIAPIRQPDGRVTHYLAIKEDVTEKKRIAEELDQHRNHLVDLVAERTMQLAQAKDAAEAANRAKSAFLANISHEIRTPMNAILGLTHLLKRDKPSENQKDRLDKISNSANHLLSILNDVLDISKIESDKLILEQVPFALAEVIEKLESLISDTLLSKNLKFRVELDGLPPILIGDATRVSQVLLNYLGNALKFTPEGSISLSGRVEEEGTNTVLVRFEVTDSGIGINREARDRLFQAFEQADTSTTRSYGGTGLGLAINKRLARLMGGEVGVESEPGKGSTFWITLRLGKVDWLDKTPAAQVHPAGSPKQGFSNCRVLLVEDDPINQEVAMELLREDGGLQVELANNGAQAVEMARQGTYDLILMDMQMPVMDGLTATRAIRQIPGHTDTPILAMTANAFEEDRQQCTAAGMSGHLSKPVDPEVLFRTLQQWLGRKPPSA